MKYCLGTVQFGMNYGIQGNGQPDYSNVDKMLSYAIDHGISVFDTASAYGEAETVLGTFIKNHPESGGNMRFVSKLHPKAFDALPVEKWRDAVEKNAAQSLSQLGIRKLEAYLFHNAAHIFNPDAVDALSVAVEKGYADTIGVSIYSPEEAMKALDYPQIGAIQIPYNLFDRRLDKCGFFEKAEKNGVTVYARSSLLQGLAIMDPNSLPQRVEFARDYLCRFADICRAYEIRPLNAAIGYVAAKQGIHYIVFGVDNLCQLEEYISLQDQVLPAEMVKEIDAAFENVEEKLVNPVLWNA